MKKLKAGGKARKASNAFVLGMAFVIVAIVFSFGDAWAREATIARKGEQMSLDPHFSRVGPNQHTAMHIFDRLTSRDENMTIVPGLAESWRQIDDLTLEFKLRPGVKFHDGSDFTAEDVKFSMERAPNVPNSPASFKRSVKQIKKITVVDPLTIRFQSKAPYPLFLGDLGRIYIVSHKVATNATSDDFNSGKAAIGTGPFKLVEWVNGERLILKRNDNYWGKKPAWERVTFKFISNDAARVAALLSGGVDMIEMVPPSDLDSLRKAKGIKLWQTAASRMIYLHMDSNREQTPFVTDKAGKPLGRNPFKDKRVRLALSKLIPRQALVDRIFYGSGQPAGQMVPSGLFGHDPSLKPVAYDTDGARRLLAEAGYPDGFGVTIHGPNNRYLYDARVVETVAQFLAKAGIDAKVHTMPKNVFFTRAGKLEFSLFLVGIGNSSADALPSLTSLMATNDKKTKMGGGNRGRYSNPALDEKIMKATVEMDPEKREKLLQEAAEIGFGDVGIIPLYFEASNWATRKGFKYIARRDGRTIAMSLVPDK